MDQNSAITSWLAMSIQIFFIVSLALVVVYAVRASFKTKLAQQETLRAAIEAGQTLDEHTLKLLIKTPRLPEADLRQGVITACLAVGFALAAMLSQFMERFGDLATVIGMIAIILGAIGAGQLIAWKVRAAPQPAAPDQP